jgi:hypothetical protein
MKRLPLVLAAVVAGASIWLAGLGTSVAETSGCQTITANLDLENPVTCTGDNATTQTRIQNTWQVSGHVACNFSGWRSRDESASSLMVTATGRCGTGAGAGAGEYGHCPPTMGSPVAAFQLEEATESVSWVSSDLSGSQCIGAGQGTEVKHMYLIGSCSGSYCCDNTAQDECNHVGEFSNCNCTLSPVLIDTAGNGFSLTDARSGVAFDLNADGKLDNLAWTELGTDDAFLALDRNYNGVIDDGSELFGSPTPQDPIPHPNGFNALVRFDDNHDGIISSDDPIFSQLLLWTDTNHSGRTEPGELRSLRSAGIQSISLNYHESRRTDAYGNIFRYWTKMATEKGAADKKAVDVFLKGVEW